MKKTISIILIILIFVLLGYVATKQKELTEQSQNQIKTIPKLAGGEYSIKFEIPEDQFRFPDKLPLLQTAKKEPFGKDYINNIASSLDFSDPPMNTNDTRFGETLIYNNGRAGLTVYSQIRSLSYGLFENLAGRGIDQSIDYRSIAERFLIEELLLDPKNFSYISTVYIAESHEFTSENLQLITPEQSQYIQINFSQNINDIKIITLNPQTYLYKVILRTNGAVQKVEVNEIGQILESNQMADVKDYSQVINSLDQAELISLDDGNILIDVSRGDVISEATVKKIDIAYLIADAKSTILQPIFILTGSAVLEQTGREVNAVLYISAID